MNQEDVYTYNLFFLCIYIHGCFLKWWYPQNTQKWPFLVGKPMVVGETHHFRKPPHIYYIYIHPPHTTCCLLPFQPGGFTSHPRSKHKSATKGKSRCNAWRFWWIPRWVRCWFEHTWLEISGRKLGAKWPRNFEENSFQIGGLKATKVVFFFFFVSSVSYWCRSCKWDRCFFSFFFVAD